MEKEPKNNEQTFEELKSILSGVIDGPEMLKNYEKVTDFFADFKERHPDWRDYRLAHLIAGSSPKSEAELKFDLPDHELENFIRGLTAEE